MANSTKISYLFDVDMTEYFCQMPRLDDSCTKPHSKYRMSMQTARYIAQGNPQIDDEITEKGRFRTGTSLTADYTRSIGHCYSYADAKSWKPETDLELRKTSAKDCPEFTKDELSREFPAKQVFLSL